MEEKHYPIIEEEDFTLNDKVDEPIGAVAYADEEVALMECDEDWDRDDMPLIGPASYEEAIARIEASERECEEGKGTPWDVVMQEAKDLILKKYGTAVY
jgi:predicted RNA-binding protein associated with RNAse of E/G family